MDTATAATVITLTATGWTLTAGYARHQFHTAHTDSLTGLANRDTLPLLVRRATRGRRAGAVGLVMLDVDRFKSINDTHGHDTGNHVLAVLAGRLSEHARPGECAIRLHGDEFALWLGAIPTGPAGRRLAEGRADTVRAVLADPIDIDGHRLTVTVSTGPIALPAAGLSTAALLAGADHALYAAKRATYQATSRRLPAPGTTARLRDTRKDAA